jgi:hypothetical protein
LKGFSQHFGSLFSKQTVEQAVEPLPPPVLLLAINHQTQCLRWGSLSACLSVCLSVVGLAALSFFVFEFLWILHDEKKKHVF